MKAKAASNWVKNNQELLIKSGMVVGGAVFVVYLLRASGIIKSKAELEAERKKRELAENNSTSTNSPFNPNYYKGKPGAMLITKAQAQGYAKTIYDAVGWVYDDESVIYAVFRQLKAKTQVSWLAEIFYQMYHEDLYNYLNDSLNEKEMHTINTIVNGMA